MGNLSSAIIEARKRHEAEIAERLKRRQQRQRAEIERLNASATTATSQPKLPDAVEPDPPQPKAVVAEPMPPAVSEPLASLPPPPPVERLQAAPTPQPPVRRPRPAQQRSDEVETLPDGRFLRVRNDIIDRIKPFLTGNQFAVYMEIYRQTVGRGKTSAWFRTREIQTACNLGSDNTVRDAYPVLEQKRLIRLDPNRRVGSPKGILVTVLSVERALEKLERGQAEDVRAVQPSARATFVQIDRDDAQVADADGSSDVVQTMTRQYGVSPSVAPQLLDLVAENDRELLPYLFARLDRSVASGKVHNPAGLLRVWLESFDAWRPELAAERERDIEARRREQETASRDELMLDWFRFTEAEVQKRFDALDPDVRTEIEARGRAELLGKSSAVRTWTDQQWAAQLATYVRSELRRDLDGFDTWLAKTRGA